MSTDFEILGPADVPHQRNPAGRTITSSDARTFWKRHPSVAPRRGCYVFAMRAGRGVTPAYVGKATGSFQAEVFTPHKLNKYLNCLSLYRKGTPVLFFVALPVKRGKPNAKHIGDLENHLIQAGISVNPKLQNERGIKEVAWTISGALRSGRGRPSKAAKGFRTAMGL